MIPVGRFQLRTLCDSKDMFLKAYFSCGVCLLPHEEINYFSGKEQRLVMEFCRCTNFYIEVGRF